MNSEEVRVQRDQRRVVVVREGGSLKWLLMGAALGAGLALLFAPKTGKEIRRQLGKGIRRARDLADGTLDELKRELADEDPTDRPMSDATAYDDEDADVAEPKRPSRPSLVSAREELERRLAAARARRREAPAPDEEEPVA